MLHPVFSQDLESFEMGAVIDRISGEGSPGRIHS